MEIEEAFDKIMSILTDANARGITPSIRITREEWVCTLEDKQVKTNIIAKEGELIIVSMDSQKGRPEVNRYKAPDLTRQKIIERIEQALTKMRAD